MTVMCKNGNGTELERKYLQNGIGTEKEVSQKTGTEMKGHFRLWYWNRKGKYWRNVNNAGFTRHAFRAEV